MKVFYLGVDVSKKKLDLCLRSNGKDILYDVIPNDLSSIKSWLTRTFEKFFLSEDSLVVCAEHTGQYTYPLVCATKSIGVYLCLEDAAKIKYCHGIPRGKNDKIDACRIAMYAERYNDCLQPYTASELIIQKLKNLSTERSMLVADRAKYQSQLKDQVDYMEHSIYIAKCNRVEGIINTFTDYIAQIDLEIKELINQAPVIAHQMDLLMSVDGVGERVALKMIMETDAFTFFTDPRKFCCHAGVVPFVYVSGSSQRSKNRVSNRADKSIKHLLHMAALSVSQVKNSPLKKYYDRKVEEGKNKMSVLNAVRAKLVTIMFAVIRTDAFFFEKLSKFACVIHKNRGGSTRPDERDFSYLSTAFTNIFHRSSHLYALMRSNIIVCIYGIGYTFIQLFKAVICTVKKPPILDRVIHPFSQSIM